MQTTRGDLTVVRRHTARSSPLRAWSAADVLVIDELLSGERTASTLGRMLIVNDEFGALACGFSDANPAVWTDSALSRLSIDKNLETNGLAPLSERQHIPGHEQPGGEFDTVVVRIPKTSALLEHQLRVVGSLTAADAVVVGTGMVRHIHTSTVEAFERLIGPTTTSRATRKARLIHSAPTNRAQPAPPLDETRFTTPSGVQVVELPGTFSAGHLDVGSALLLQVLHERAAPEDDAIVADLGCGNGVLAAELARTWPNANFQLLDVSDLAIEAATRTWAANELGDRMTTEAADGFSTTATDSVDMVITNPPFHQGHALDAAMTDRLLADAARVLRHDGIAYVVAQRHLHLHTRMKQWFAEVDVVSKHPSHVVLVASHPHPKK